MLTIAVGLQSDDENTDDNTTVILTLKGADNGSVWRQACVKTFITQGAQVIYIN